MVNQQIKPRGVPSPPNATSVCYTTKTNCIVLKPSSAATSSALCPTIGTPTATRACRQQGTVTITKSVMRAQHTSSAQAQVAQTSTWPTRSDLAAISAATAAVSLIVGAVAMLYFMKRRAKKFARVRASDGFNNPQDTTELVDLAGVTRTRSNSGPGPVPSNDFADELISELQDLSTKIQDHVESTYGLEEPQDNELDGLVQAVACLSFPKKDAQLLAYLCAFPRTRYAALRHIIAATILSAIDFGTYHDTILLPPALLAFWATLPSPHGDKQRIEALWHWQKLSLGLLQRRPTSTTTITQASQDLTSIQPQISKLQAFLTPILEHFTTTTTTTTITPSSSHRDNNGEPSHQQNRPERDQPSQPANHSQPPLQQPPNLTDLIHAAAALGRTLLAQPRRWAFDWHHPPDHNTDNNNNNNSNTDNNNNTNNNNDNNNRDVLVIQPSLLLVSNEVGQALDCPVLVMPAVVVNVGVQEGGRGRGKERERMW